MAAVAETDVLARRSLAVTGMTCAACAGRVEKALARVPGVAQASVNLATEEASVLAPPQLPVGELIAAVEKAGYGAHVPTPALPPARDRSGWAVVAAALFTLPLLVPMLSAGRIVLPSLAALLLASVVQFGLGARFYRSGWHALRAGSPNMDVLVALGTSAAYGLSVYGLWAGHATELYFESGAVVITLVLLGKWLESRAKGQAGQALRALARLKPENALVRRDGSDTAIPIDQVQVGDVVVVGPGTQVPVDGVVLEGTSSADEAFLTGESLPVIKSVGDTVATGAVNQEGLLLVRATAVGGQTLFARIVDLVENAQTQKAPIQRLVDQISAVFVPAVLVISLITFVLTWIVTKDWQHALLNAVAVQVISCPCALGLATPTALVVGTGLAARMGILIRGPEVLEAARSISVVAFDKTGTLTTGRPALVAMSGDAITMLAHARALQEGVAHPLADAVVREAKRRGVAPTPVVDLHAVPGLGVEGRYQGQLIRLGSTRWMRELGMPLKPWKAAFEHESSGESVSWLSFGREVLGFLVFADEVKPTAAQAVARLAARGLEVVLVSGDSVEVAERVGKQLGIASIRAQVLPEDKVAVIESLRQGQGQRRHVAMVGDGINDAPALAAADLGIALAQGTDVALEAAGMVLMRSDPAQVDDALEIARRTAAKIRQNLAWAFVYNVIGIPLAAFGYLNPMLAGAAMALSSVSVVTNALLLKTWRPR